MMNVKTVTGRRGFLRLAMGWVALMGTLGMPRLILERARTWAVYGNGHDGDLVLESDTVLSPDRARRYETLEFGGAVTPPNLEIYLVRTLRFPK
jgi:hypothetical protein